MKQKLESRLEILKIGLIISIFLYLTILIFGGNIDPAFTQEIEFQPPPPLENPNPSNDECLECHQEPDMIMQLPSEEELNLTVDRILYNTSIHGREGYACIQCHTDFTGFPHPPQNAQTLRELSIESNKVCLDCHQDQSEEYAKGRHAQASILGDQNAALCVDCHGSHQTKELSVSDIDITQTCRNCHASIYDVYQESVHGNALLEESGQDVPGCIDCHDSHDNKGPGDAGFLLSSPQICADCHADEKMMEKYDVNTHVFETYLSDFHGTTVSIFEQMSPDQEFNKPVCIDCHGVHNILSPSDENSSVIKENLDKTCQRCHPDASPEFSNAWMSHYPPDINHNPIVFLVTGFYKFMIPIVIGGMLIFIASDVWKKSKIDSETEDGEIAE